MNQQQIELEKEKTRRARIGGILVLVFIVFGFALGSFYQKAADSTQYVQVQK